MDLESLESFLEVEKHKNFTKSGRKPVLYPGSGLHAHQATGNSPGMRPVQTLRPACGADQRGRDFPALCQADGEYLEVCVGTPAADQADGGKRDTDHLLQHAGTYIIPSLIYLFRQSYPFT